jgi:xylulokinase
MGAESQAILVFDVGLTRVKTALVNARGELVDWVALSYTTVRRGDRVEQDPDQWWGAMRLSLSRLEERGHPLRSSVAGVSITGHMHALVCVDDNGMHLGPAIVLGDARAASESESLIRGLGQDVFHRTTGARLDPSMPAAKIAWIARHEPERLASSRLLVGVKDYLRLRLTGDRYTDPLDATATSMFDITEGTWAPEILERVGISDELLPDVVAPESIAGVVNAEAAREFGLSAGIPVVVGAGDDVEILGRGLTRHGDLLEHIGTTGAMMAVLAEPVFDPTMALETYPHALPNLWVIGGSMTNAGSALEWVHTTLGIVDFAAATDTIASASGSRPIFLPNMSGARAPEWQPMARGAWVGLTVSSTREDIMASAFEGVAFELAGILDRILELTAADGPVHATGVDGDRAWLGLRAAAYGLQMAVSEVDPTVVGAAMLGTGGVGIHRDLYAAVEAMAPPETVIEPDPELGPILAGRKRGHRAATESLSPLWSRLGLS